MKAITRSRNSRARAENSASSIIPDSPDMDPPSCSFPDHAAEIGKARGVVVGIAEQLLDHGRTLEGVRHLVFHGDRHPAMQLHRVLADEAAGIPDLYFRCRDGAGAFARVLF